MAGRAGDPTITTERLVLHPLRVDDAEEMVTVLADPALHTFTGGQPATIDELRRRFAGWVEGSGSDEEQWRNWIVRLAGDATAIGTVQATVVTRQPGERRSTAYVAWTIGTPWQGNGYAGEAARGLVRWLAGHGVDEIAAHVHPDHAASAGVATRAGLHPTDEIADGEVVWRLGADRRRTIT